VVVEAFDRVVLEVPDVAVAAGELSVLLATDPVRADDGSTLLLLGNTSLELRQTEGDRASISGLVFSATADQGEGDLPGNIELCSGDVTSDLRGGGTPVSDLQVDHVVLQTRAAETCIALYRDQLGIRLALDRDMPDWGGRMLFFRTGKMTLEVIANAEKGPEIPSFWGVAFQCEDLDREHQRLADAGVSLSNIREGRKPGTRVATVKSHCLGVPTLLIEPAPR